MWGGVGGPETGGLPLQIWWLFLGSSAWILSTQGRIQDFAKFGWGGGARCMLDHLRCAMGAWTALSGNFEFWSQLGGGGLRVPDPGGCVSPQSPPGSAGSANGTRTNFSDASLKSKRILFFTQTRIAARYLCALGAVVGLTHYPI